WTTVAVDATLRRFSVTTGSNVTSVTAGIRIATSGDAVRMVAAQVERYSDATAYIPTTSATVSRATEMIEASSLVPLRYRATAGTLYAAAVAGPSGKQRTWLQLDDGSESNRIM